MAERSLPNSIHNGWAAPRKSYARVPETWPIPDLIKTQIESYDRLRSVGLRELFDEISPITDYRETLELHFPGYNEDINRDFRLNFRFDEPSLTVTECREREVTYAAPWYVTVLLYNRDTDQPIVQEVYMGDLPLMTEKGTFIVNGAERVVVSQLIRSPGAYFSLEEHRSSGRMLAEARLIPDHGAWLQFDTSRRDVLSVRMNRQRKLPVTLLLRALGAVSDGIDDVAISEGSDEELRALLEDVDLDADHSYLTGTIERDPTTSAEEALLELYKRMRPGDPNTPERARDYLESQLFDMTRYDLGKVGRYKLNRRLELDVPEERRSLTKADIVALVRHLIEVNNGIREPNDMDHLGNRRIKTVGELVQNQLRVGLRRMERLVQRRMSTRDKDQVSPVTLMNARPVIGAINGFFGGSQLSQFMGQTNLLDELTHKRTLSALGPGGLRREHAGFEVRDVHFSHYGRICPIETPEGPNIGLIARLATYAEVNEMGFVETPYRRVRRVVENKPEALLGRTLRERVVDPDSGEVLADEGDVVTAELAESLARRDLETVRVRPFVTEEINYLSADEEERYVIVQANAPVDDLGQFQRDRVSARVYDQFIIADIGRASFMDVSPKQVVGVSAALIPFLEHDDANRALMGSNMQRQAVPVIRPEAPVVGTGMEAYAAIDSGQIVVAEEDGIVRHVTEGRIVIEGTGNGAAGAYRVYELRKFGRSNQSTCINQRPIVSRGERVVAGQPIADTSSSVNSELALGQNVLGAFMFWEGGNFEDAILVSEELIREDKFTSIHIEKHDCEARDTKLGPEEITRDIPNVAIEELANLDEEGVVHLGAYVRAGDILVGKITPKGERQLTPEERLLQAIFGEKARDVRDTSLRVPHGEEGVVIGVHVFDRSDYPDLDNGVEKMVRVDIAQRLKLSEGDKMAGRHGNKGVISRVVPLGDMPYLEDGTPIQIILSPLGVPGRMNVGQVLETHLGWAADRLGLHVATPVSDGASEDEIAAELARAWLMDRAWYALLDRAWPWLEEAEVDAEALRDDDAVRSLYLGNYIAEHGHDASEVEATLASRAAMRRVWLSLWLAERGYDADAFMVYDLDAHDDQHEPNGGSRERADELAREVCLRIWLADEGLADEGLVDEGLDVDALSRDEVTRLALTRSQEIGVPLPTTGKMTLYDGKTGEPYDQPVTVGVIYMMKLIHIVRDKVHARATGPYSLVTQQPLGGKAQFGGQRFGEMEVWALEAYGAAHSLKEMLTIKSDDVRGRVDAYEAIVKGEPVPGFGVPESFQVLIRELRSLGLDVEMLDEDGEALSFDRRRHAQRMPTFGLGFGRWN